MINNDTMFQLYKAALSDKGRAILDSCIIPVAEHNLILELLNDIKVIHPEYKSYKAINDFTEEQIINLRISPNHKLFINSYLKSCKIVKDNEVKAGLASKVKINRQHFGFILLTFNRLLWKEMIENAYVFRHYLIGQLYVVCREDKKCKPKINWKVSNKNRKAIVEKGGIPAIELESRTARFNNEEYNGEDWIEKHKPFNVTIKWRRAGYANSVVGAIKDFNMRLCRNVLGNGPVDKLKETRDNNKIEDLILKYHRSNE